MPVGLVCLSLTSFWLGLWLGMLIARRRAQAELETLRAELERQRQPRRSRQPSPPAVVRAAEEVARRAWESRL
jgi:hypothetical protein